MTDDRPRSALVRFLQQLETNEKSETQRDTVREFLTATEIPFAEEIRPERASDVCSQVIMRAVAAAIAGENHAKVLVVSHKVIGPKRFGSDDNSGRLTGVTSDIADTCNRLGLFVDVVPANDTPAEMILSWGSWVNEEDVKRFKNTVRAIEIMSGSSPTPTS